MFFQSWMLYPFSYLSSCTLCLRSKLQEKIEWQKFVSCTSRPHVMCGPLAVKVATCSLLPGHHHLACLNLAILSIANNSRELTIASFHSVEECDPSRNISSMSRHSPCKKPCYSLNGKIYPPEHWSEQSGRGMKMRSPPTFPWCVWILPT